VLFLDRLSYPTSVQPWRDGALVIAAPEILFVADRDGDGYAEHREAWVTGLPTGNPQHQASGFEVGLDGWLHFAAGEGARELRSEKTGQVCDVRGCDVAWNPDTGELRATAGVTQFIPARDAFGQWFGHDNTYPMYHFPIDAQYARGRRWSGPRDQDLLSPAAAAPVLPRSRTVDRFNDLYTLNRFTSACSSMIVRNPGAADDAGVTGLICEPVHNLVARIRIEPAGSSFQAARHPNDRQFDFFTSTDPWSRPVRAVNAPDGSVWIVDMVRQVIEHPEWIPLDWQAAVDVGAGARSGRIYRVFRTDRPAGRLPELGSDSAELVAALASEYGAVRDLSLLAILQAEQPPMRDALVRLLRDDRRAEVRVAALGCLAGGGWLQPGDVEFALQDADPRVVRYALELTERFDLEGALGTAFRATVERNLGAQVDLQWVLTALQLPPAWNLAGPLATILERHPDDPWIGRAVSLVESPEAALLAANRLLEAWDARRAAAPDEFAEAQQCVAQLWRRAPAPARTAAASERFERLAELADSAPRAGDVLLLAALAREAALEGGYDTRGLEELASQAARRVREQLSSSSVSATERSWLVQALGNGLASEQEELQTARALLEGERESAVRVALIETLRRLSSAEAASLLLDAWPQLGAAERRAACATLLSRRAWVEQLVTALEQGSVATRDLDPAAAQQLRSYGDRDLRNRCEQALGQPTDRAAVVATYLAELPATSDFGAGERLFHEHCAVCHAARGAAAAIGPSLDNLGHWTLDQWVGSVLDPNRAVEPRYRQTLVLTHEGQSFAGIALEHSAAGLQLALSDGSVRTWETADLAEVQESGLSLMPEGFETKLSPAQLADLLGYLRSRGGSAGADGAAANRSGE
jgi:putative membrane-bound dehydrogenase-like protein